MPPVTKKNHVKKIHTIINKKISGVTELTQAAWRWARRALLLAAGAGWSAGAGGAGWSAGGLGALFKYCNNKQSLSKKSGRSYRYRSQLRHLQLGPGGPRPHRLSIPAENKQGCVNRIRRRSALSLKHDNEKLTTTQRRLLWGQGT